MSESHVKDQEDIRNLKSVYARRADAALCTPSAEAARALVELFVDDALLDLGPFGRYQGREQLLHAFENVLPGATAWSVHHFTNPLIEVKGDSATGSWYFLIYAQSRATPAPPVGVIHGGYSDKYVRVGGAWKIAETIASFTAPAT